MYIQKHLLLSYQHEYETTPMTIEDLEHKYDITLSKEQTQDWNKPQTASKTTKPVVLDVLPQTSDAPQPIKPNLVSQKTNDPMPTELKTSIEEFKSLAVTHCLSQVKQAQFLEVKEFKDLVAVVDSVEKSYVSKDKGDAPIQVNFVVQNLLGRYADDC